MSLYAIGDLHGCPDELDVLLEALTPGVGDTVVFLGDYVDRGPAVRRLVDRLLHLDREPFTSVFLRGNHEDMLLGYLGIGGLHADVYLENGGGMTLASYGIPAGTGPGAASRAVFPDEHVSFFQRCRMRHLAPPFLFVHAGIRPGVGLDDQSAEDLLWIREEFFLRPHALPYTVVFGHTPSREARIDLPYRIGLDTGLVYGNKLSCLDVDGRRLVQVARGARHTTIRDLAPAFAAAHV
ncbi:MAG: serine/threonine protein phosphatase [Deltaproteobacteria bacterium]|nr:serine/threonine protein phosphatase [Deltaproteobacteria bacterium]